MIQVFQPTIGPAEQAAAAAVLASGWIGFGPKVLEFERAWAAHIGVPVDNVVSVSCATEGLYQVFADMRFGNGAFTRRHEVIIPAISFIGIANAVRDSNELTVRLCDVDRHTLNPTVADIERVMDGDTLAVCIQHYGGVPSDLGPIADLCRERGVMLVEDCACAPLSFYDGKRAGTFGDFAVWSFDAMKIITAGDGGMVYCRDAAVAEQIRKATRLGQDNLSGQSSSGPKWWEFTVQTPGRKAFMNDLQAAVGLVQLGRLEELVQVRYARVEDYARRLKGIPGITPAPWPDSDNSDSSYYSYWIQTDRRDDLASFLRSAGVYTTMRYWPVHRAYNWTGEYPGADEAASRTLNLPLHANLTTEQVERIIDLINTWEPR